MNKKKRNKIIKMIDPEPKTCGCGSYYIDRDRTILDVVREKVWIGAPRDDLSDYLYHLVGCLWADWARRETTRRAQ